MSTTTNLNITKVADRQLQPELTINAGTDALDLALGGITSRSLAGLTTYTLTADEARTAVIILTGALGAGCTVKIPVTAGTGRLRRLIFINSTTGGQTITLSTTGTPVSTVAVSAAGAVVEVYHDGNSVFQVYSSAGHFTGTGTTGKLAKFSSSSTIADSIMSESGATITVAGNVDSQTPLTVTGANARSNLRGDNGTTPQYVIQNGAGTDHWAIYSTLGGGGAQGNFVIHDYVVAAARITVAVTTGNVTIANNLSVTGALTKGSGTFLIDHPLDPENKNLYHAFTESPEYLLIYRGRVKLKKGKASVSIDEACRMMPGTFAALTQRADVHSLTNRSGFARVRATEVVNGSFDILCEDTNSADEVTWSVYAERNDSFIHTVENVGKDGRLIPEWDKQSVPQAELSAMLSPSTRVVESHEEKPDQIIQETVSELIGKKGFPLHASATGKGSVPKRTVKIKTVKPIEEEKGDAHK